MKVECIDGRLNQGRDELVLRELELLFLNELCVSGDRKRGGLCQGNGAADGEGDGDEDEAGRGGR